VCQLRNKQELVNLFSNHEHDGKILILSVFFVHWRTCTLHRKAGPNHIITFLFMHIGQSCGLNVRSINSE